MEAITEFLQLIQAVFGVAPVDFLMVSMTVSILVIIIRRALQLHPKLAVVNKREWGKGLLILLTLVLGVAMGFVSRKAGVYETENAIMTAWVGFWNGVLASLLWQGAKRFKALRGFTEGSDRNA